MRYEGISSLSNNFLYFFESFFDEIPLVELPVFVTEIELSQIVIEPKIKDEETQRVVEKLKDFTKRDFWIFIVTNQAGIAHGLFSEKEFFLFSDFYGVCFGDHLFFFFAGVLCWLGGAILS